MYPLYLYLEDCCDNVRGDIACWNIGRHLHRRGVMSRGGFVVVVVVAYPFIFFLYNNSSR